MRLFLMIVVLLMVQYKTFGQCWNPDSNSDGIVGVDDVLSILIVFGNEFTPSCYEENPCENEESISYNNYVYSIVPIGDQCWFAENLQTEQYADSSTIPNVTNFTEWTNNTGSGSQCVYNNDENNTATYGRLYNWYAVDDPRGLCPSGWHVPSKNEFAILIDTLCGPLLAGHAMKSSPSDSPSWDGSNTSGFSALPGGQIGQGNSFNAINSKGYWWTSTSNGSYSAWYIHLGSSFEVYESSYDYLVGRTYGRSVRCVKD